MLKPLPGFSLSDMNLTNNLWPVEMMTGGRASPLYLPNRAPFSESPSRTSIQSPAPRDRSSNYNQTQLRMVQIFLQHVTGTCHQIKCGFFLKKFCLLQILQKWIKYYCNFFHFNFFKILELPIKHKNRPLLTNAYVWGFFVCLQYQN